MKPDGIGARHIAHPITHRERQLASRLRPQILPRNQISPWNRIERLPPRTPQHGRTVRFDKFGILKSCELLLLFFYREIWMLLFCKRFGD